MYTDPDFQPFWCSLNSNLLSLSHCFQPTLVFSRSVVHLYTALFCFSLLPLCSCWTLFLLLSPCLKDFLLSLFSFFQLLHPERFIPKHRIFSFLPFLFFVLTWQFHWHSSFSLLHKHLNKYSFSRPRLNFLTNTFFLSLGNMLFCGSQWWANDKKKINISLPAVFCWRHMEGIWTSRHFLWKGIRIWEWSFAQKNPIHYITKSN